MIQEDLKDFYEKLKKDPEFAAFCSLENVPYVEYLEKLYSLELYKNAKPYEKGTIMKSALCNFHNKIVMTSRVGPDDLIDFVLCGSSDKKWEYLKNSVGD